MTEFSNSAFINVGPQSEWSSSWNPMGQTPNIQNPKFSFPTNTSNNGGWTTTWDVSVNANPKNNPSWSQSAIKSPAKQQQAQTTPVSSVNVGGWSTTWEIPTPEKSQKPVLVVTPNTKVPSVPTKAANEVLAVVDPNMTPQKQVAIETAIQQENDQQTQHELNKSSLYKTELCRSWMEKGTCKYGHKCQFAHGEDELRIVVRHPKYKTEFCKTFTATGACPYGNRCRFIHPSSEDSLATTNQHQNNKFENTKQKSQEHSSAAQPFQTIFSPSGSITPPEVSVSPLKNAFELNDLLSMLPNNNVNNVNNNNSNNVTSDDKEDIDHRLSFFKHLTQI